MLRRLRHTVGRAAIGLLAAYVLLIGIEQMRIVLGAEVGRIDTGATLENRYGSTEPVTNPMPQNEAGHRHGLDCCLPTGCMLLSWYLPQAMDVITPVPPPKRDQPLRRPVLPLIGLTQMPAVPPPRQIV